VRLAAIGRLPSNVAAFSVGSRTFSHRRCRIKRHDHKQLNWASLSYPRYKASARSRIHTLLRNGRFGGKVAPSMGSPREERSGAPEHSSGPLSFQTPAPSVVRTRKTNSFRGQNLNPHFGQLSSNRGGYAKPAVVNVNDLGAI
jgi:hypothetical protein